MTKKTDEHKKFSLRVREIIRKYFPDADDKEAMDILFGEQYEDQRNNYERGIEQLNTFLKKQMDAALAVV
jgi:hypothetical protein